jgi:hypothetical protein
VELAAAEVMQRRLGELAEPYRQQPARRYAALARACTAGGALLLGTLGRRRAAAVAGGLLAMGGSAFQRFAIHKAGDLSAADPRYVVEPQRKRLAAR